MTPREPLSRQRAPGNAQVCSASREKGPLAHKPAQLLSSEEGAKLLKARFQGSRAQVARVHAGLERSCPGGRRRGAEDPEPGRVRARLALCLRRGEALAALCSPAHPTHRQRACA